MTAPGGRFSDLTVRTVSGAVIALVCVLVIEAGGVAFTLLVGAIGAGMMWEAHRMLADPPRPDAAIALAGAVLAALILAGNIELSWMLVICAAALLAAWLTPPRRLAAALWVAAILLASLGIIRLRVSDGVVWMYWFAAVVVAVDILGYFAGRLIGGPKLWPVVSPKKTWSGTLAGWAGAVAVGAAFAGPTGAGWVLLPLSLFAAMAAQAGDLVESAAKRAAGIKDASGLLPGHGGVMDRFDGMMGAGLFMVALRSADLMPGM
jgi:phosphatidate cytidylyltransferase